MDYRRTMKDLDFKRIFDIFLAFICITLSIPFWFLFAFLIWVKDKGPVFYIQSRIGKDGKVFKVLKFRTMNLNKGINGDMSRFLRNTALDEILQFINILKGDMSFVGPRPLIREDVERLKGSKLFEERVKILPGLTGISQVLLPKTATEEEKFQYDIWYNKNRNSLMDIELILVSYLISLSGRWEANADKINTLSRLKKKVDASLKEIINV